MIATRRLCLSMGLALAGAAGCGGSSSETPWPVEPDGVDLAPEGESRDREPVPAAPTTEPADAPPEPADEGEAPPPP
jgi:hypothetical protein